MKGPWRMLGMLIAVGVVAGASIAIAAPGGSSSPSQTGSEPGSSSDTREFRQLRGPGPRGESLSALADELGVTTAELREALEAVREEVRPPRPPSGEHPTREEMRRLMQQACTEFTNALGEELGKSGDDVRAALKEVAKDRVDAAEKAGKLTEAQADRLRQRIESADCTHLGPHKIGFGGCGGPGPGGRGPGRPDGDGPDDNGSNGNSGSTAPSYAPVAPEAFAG